MEQGVVERPKVRVILHKKNAEKPTKERGLKMTEDDMKDLRYLMYQWLINKGLVQDKEEAKEMLKANGFLISNGISLKGAAKLKKERDKAISEFGQLKGLLKQLSIYTK